MFAVVETCDNKPLSLHLKKTRKKAVELAIRLAEENTETLGVAAKFVTDHGFWEEGNYRVTVLDTTSK